MATNPYAAPANYQQAYEQARRANEQRYQQMLGIWDEVINQYKPGGGFGQGALALYEQGKQQALASGMQNLVSAGLSNTTVAAGMPIKYEQEVGMPFRLQLADLQTSRYSEALAGKAGAIERRYDEYPDARMYADLQRAAAEAKAAQTAYVPSFSAGRNYSGFLGGSIFGSGGGGGGGSSFSSGAFGGSDFLGGMGSELGGGLSAPTGGGSSGRIGNYLALAGGKGGLFSGITGIDYSKYKGEEMTDEELAALIEKNKQLNQPAATQPAQTQQAASQGGLPPNAKIEFNWYNNTAYVVDKTTKKVLGTWENNKFVPSKTK